MLFFLQEITDFLIYLHVHILALGINVLCDILDYIGLSIILMLLTSPTYIINFVKLLNKFAFFVIHVGMDKMCPKGEPIARPTVRGIGIKMIINNISVVQHRTLRRIVCLTESGESEKYAFKI